MELGGSQQLAQNKVPPVSTPPPRWKSLWASLVAQMVKNLPTMKETEVKFLGREDPLEKGIATPSSILTWRIPWSRKESDTTEQLTLLPPKWALTEQ